MSLAGFKKIIPLAGRNYCSLARAAPDSGESTLIMIPSAPFPPDRAHTLLERELRITGQTDITGVIRSRAFSDAASPALLLDDFPGMPIDFFSGTLRADMRGMLSAAVAIADALSSVHTADITHRTLDSGSILLAGVDAGRYDYTAAFTFFALSASPDAPGPPLREHSDCMAWEYAPPEATGMADHPVDRRSDLYSLGIVLYELLTGAVPYRSGDIADTMHWHMTQTPRPPREVNGSVPGVVSDIVMLLLEKDPSARYPDSETLAGDLRTCLTRLTTSGDIKTFKPGGTSAPGIHFPERTFGRGREISAMLGSLERAIAGESVLTLIAGGPGIGKTALVRELTPDMEAAEGRFAYGKFDQYRHDLPYAAFGDALGAVVRHILMGNDSELEEWRKRIDRALAPNTRLMTDLVPGLVHVTGEQKPAPATDPGNEANRFTHCFRDFLSILAGRSTPLILFLDDLQWADASSLSLIAHLALSYPVPGLWLIGAFRDSEVAPDHPLIKLTAEFNHSPPGRQVIRLGPLDGDSVEEMIAGSLCAGRSKVRRLARIIHRKTAGNPFFVKQFTHSLHAAGHISHSGHEGWSWDAHACADMPVTDNVVELLAGKIGTLPADQRAVLKTASCVSGNIIPDFLGLVMDANPSMTALFMSRLAKSDFLTRNTDGSFSFAHDRIQEAAYGTIPPTERAALHRRIGDMMLRLCGGNLDGRIFEIADQINRAVHGDLDSAALKELVEINRTAGMKAKSSAAFDAAARYFGNAISIVKHCPGPAERPLHYSLHRFHAECLYLNGEFDRAEEEIGKALHYADSEFQKADINNVFIVLKTYQLKLDEAIECGIRTLHMLGLGYSQDAQERMAQIAEEKRRVDVYLENATVEDIINLPVCSNEKVKQAMKILRSTNAAGYLAADITVRDISSLMITSFSFQHGLTPESTCGFVSYGVVLASHEGKISLAYKLGEASMVIPHRFPDSSKLCEVLLKHGFLIKYWIAHIKHSIPHLYAAIETGLKAGEYMYTGHAAGHIPLNAFAKGDPIPVCLNIIDEIMSLILRINDFFTMDILISIKHSYSCIADNINTKRNNSKTHREHILIPGYGHLKTNNAILLFHLNEILRHYIYHKYPEALHNIKCLQPFMPLFTGFFYEIDTHFYKSLILLTLFPESSKRARARAIADARALREKLEQHAARCPDNFLYRHALLAAEIARAEGDTVTAMSQYDRAVTAAREYGYTQFEAIACERAAGFWASLGKHDFAALYLRRSLERYRAWGAVRKVEMMMEQFQDLPGGAGDPDALSDADVLALVGMFNALSSQSDIEKLTAEIASVALRHTGASRFAMLMHCGPSRGARAIEAVSREGAVDVKALPADEKDEGVEAFPVEMARYMERTGEDMIRYDGTGPFSGIPYMRRARPASALCLKTDTPGGPAIWYLENAVTPGAFNGIRKGVLDLLARQAALCMENALLRAESDERKAQSVFTFKSGGETRAIHCSDITYVFSVGRNSIVHVKNASYRVSSQLNHVERELASGMFTRVHRQYIVNRQFISRLHRERSGRIAIVLNDGKETRIPVGRSYAANAAGALERRG